MSVYSEWSVSFLSKAILVMTIHVGLGFSASVTASWQKKITHSGTNMVKHIQKLKFGIHSITFSMKGPRVYTKRNTSLIKVLSA